MQLIQPLANGLHTDHPIPGLPFVDDSHIPIHDAAAVESIGRNKTEGMWGREDPGPAGQGDWLAFTTDPRNHDLAWCVRHHPVHGTTVILVRDGDASPMHADWQNSTLLYRQGGYWWDGQQWYRPKQVWDPASGDYAARPVKGAVTVSAADLLDDSADPRGGSITAITDFDIDTRPPDRWTDHLALWADKRQQRGEQLPLEKCVVRLSAPELGADQLLGLAELAEAAGIAAPTLRSYISRNQGDVPAPQAVISGRSAWARTVAADWAELRARSDENVNAVLAATDPDQLPVGQARIRDAFAKIFHSALWGHPQWRKRWALRFRTEESVREICQDLAYGVAVNVDQVLPLGDLSTTLRHALLDELAYGQDLHNQIERHSKNPTPAHFYGIGSPVARMLAWLVKTDPDRPAG
ncbi:hypothetical protein [Streptacidiphilus sp. PAMC 29251]